MQISNQEKLIKPGIIWQLGQHRLAFGDCLNKHLVEKLIGKEKIKAIISDPPYGVAYVENKAGFNQKLKCPKIITNDNLQSEKEYRDFSKQWLENIKPHLEKKNSFYIFNSDKMLFALRDAMIESGLKFSQLIVWIKNQAILGRMDYMPQHELIAVGWYGSHEFMKSKDKSVLFYPRPQKSKYHPTSKPIGLLRNLILNSTHIGDTVYDAFGGGGSTLLACEQTKRKCLLIEIDEEYCQTIIDRWEKLTGQKAKKIN